MKSLHNTIGFRCAIVRDSSIFSLAQAFTPGDSTRERTSPPVRFRRRRRRNRTGGKRGACAVPPGVNAWASEKRASQWFLAARLASLLAIVSLLIVAVAPIHAGEIRVFEEGRSGAGELKYINEIPVLIVAGTPQEIGQQKAALTGEVVKQIADYPKKLLERAHKEDRTKKCLEMCKEIAPNLPADYRAEMRAFADRSGIESDVGLMGNLLVDVYRGGFACSSIVVESERSATHAPLFGRNLDFYTLGFLNKYSLVTVHRPKGKHAFTTVGFPGLFGCLSGMNDAGLSVAVHEVFLSRDGAAMFNPKGVPYTFCFRRILEECTTRAEAEKLLRSVERTTILSLTVCDREGGVVLEMTPKSVAARHSIDGVLACTNHFRTKDLAAIVPRELCPRYPKLIQARKVEQLGVADVARKLDEVNMGPLTVQTMIFEPAELRLHLAIGSCPSSALPMKTLELKSLMKQQRRTGS
jgi:isopenicillin-N N-acyltransferase like protein